MTKDDIIRMAHEAGFSGSVARMWPEYFKAFADLVAAAEREECAKLCLETEPFYGVMFYNAIRARGNT
jgi:hypothetical protein